jgi:hypothetical protein
MKKNLIYTFITIFAITNCISQNVNFGIKAGINISSFKDSFTNKSLIGPQLGGYAEVKLNNEISIQPELLLSYQGAIYEYDKQNRLKLSINYLNLPITFKYNFVNKFAIIAGPQIGRLVKAKGIINPQQFKILNNNNEEKEEDLRDLYKTTSFSFNLGLNYSITEEIFADVRYNYGLSNIIEGNDTLFGTGVKNNVIQFSIGYRL